MSRTHKPYANMLQDDPPKLLDSYTTVVTDALGFGIIITPLLFLSSVLILRRVMTGYPIGFNSSASA